MTNKPKAAKMANALNENFSPSRLARLAYHAMVENAARLQDEITRQEVINKRFGDDALNVNRMLRGYQNNMRDHKFKTDVAKLMERHDEYIAAIREFEALFEIEEKQNMEAFAEAFKERMRRGE